MSVIRFIEQIENDLNDLKQNGHQEVNIDKLLAYMNSNKDRAIIRDEIEKCELEIARDQKQFEQQTQLEEGKFNYQLKMFDLMNLSQNNLEMFKSILDTAQTAVKSITLINGGAAIALLAFIGDKWSSQIDKNIVGLLVASIASFALGTFFSAAGAGFRYLSQHKYAQYFSDQIQHQIKIVLGKQEIVQQEEALPQSTALIVGDRHRNAAIISAILAYVAFLGGVICSAIAFYKKLA